MEAKGSGGTAQAAALMRAAHLFVDDEPKILDDTLALAFVGADYAAVFRALADTFRKPPLTAVRAIIVTRSRYAEDQLAEAMARGVSQYVILSAGLDSFAYRRRDLEMGLQVYEVDLPEIQEEKRNRLSKLGINLPGNVTFVPVDLENDTLSTVIVASGYRPDEPAFFSWLGATEYLTEEAVHRTLQGVISIAAAGSEILLQYFLPESMVRDEDKEIWEFSKRTCTERGEPWISFFEPDRLASILIGLGYSEVVDSTPRDAFDRYLHGRKDGLRPHNATHLMKARVGPR